MGRVKTFAILYDRPTYSCGEWVSGRIVLELTDQTEVKALKIHAKGQAYVHWTERHSGSKSSQTRHYTQQLRYFKHKYLLIGTGKCALAFAEVMNNPGCKVSINPATVACGCFSVRRLCL